MTNRFLTCLIHVTNPVKRLIKRTSSILCTPPIILENDNLFATCRRISLFPHSSYQLIDRGSVLDLLAMQMFIVCHYSATKRSSNNKHQMSIA